MADLDKLLPKSLLDKPVAAKAPRCVLNQINLPLFSSPPAENKNDDRGKAAEGESSGSSQPLSVWRAFLASSIARLWKHIDTMSAAGEPIMSVTEMTLSDSYVSNPSATHPLSHPHT